MAQTTLQLKMVTPAKTIFEQEVDRVTLPTEQGQITILPEHMAVVSILQPGEIIVKSGGEEFPLTVFGGVVEMNENQLIILADTAEQPSDIDIAEAQKEAERLAAELEAETEMDLTTYNTLKRQLEHAETRLRMVTKWRK